jgi:hypothetical protein
MFLAPAYYLHNADVASATTKAKEKKTMKAITLTKIATTSVLALALTAGTFQIFAAGSAKGGATALLAQPAPAAAAPAAKAMGMNCAQCKDVAGTRDTNLGKGAFVKTTSYTTHGCPSCGTKVTTTGAGKAQATSTSHECGATSSGCSAM